MPCSCTKSAVVDSRKTSAGVRRRRECTVCKRRWSTIEAVVSLKANPRAKTNLSRGRQHPLVSFAYSQIQHRRLTYTDVGKLAGLSRESIRGWRKHNPEIQNIEAVLNVLGFELTIRNRVGRKRQLPKLNGVRDEEATSNRSSFVANSGER